MRKHHLDGIIEEAYGQPAEGRFHKFRMKSIESNEGLYEVLLGSLNIFPGVTLFVDLNVEIKQFYRVFYVNMDNSKKSIMVCRTDTIGHFRHQIEELEGFPMTNVRLIYSGSQLNNDSRQLHEYHVYEDDTFTLIGRLRGDVGEWVSAASIDIARRPMSISSTTPRTTAIKGAYMFERQLIDLDTCHVLIEKIKSLVEPMAVDTKIQVSTDFLSDIVGKDKFQKMLDLVSPLVPRTSPAPKVILRCRRTLEDGDDLVIPFHLDENKVVFNVALNSSGTDYEGGVLCFIDSKGQQDEVRLQAGDASIHDCFVVHGVSNMSRGTRYNVFLAFSGN
jgi:hypothetical protein